MADQEPQARRGAGPLGVLGELLITAGVVLLLFVAWELWWTDVVAERDQAAIVSALPWREPPTDPGTGAEKIAEPQPGDPPELPTPEKGETFATLRVPRWDDRQRPVSEGVGRQEVLNPKGIGHYPGTALPGEVGNFAVAGHRTTYGKPFAKIDALRAGDALVVRTAGYWFVYTVTSSQIVRPSQTEVIAAVPGSPGAVPTQRVMTLTACHPRYSASKRYVVHARFSYWAKVSDGVPKELVEPRGKAA